MSLAGRADRLLLTLGATSALLAVALGAFGAHGLKALLPAESLSTFEIGVRYQMYHALGLIGVGCVYGRRPSRLLAASGALFVLGTVLFSGSLYVLATSGLRAMGMVAPLGGAAFLGGWACFMAAAWRS
jgi:uncharacterized membrane protein YgdD (TMEM256/DUF423 family)